MLSKIEGTWGWGYCEGYSNPFTVWDRDLGLAAHYKPSPHSKGVEINFIRASIQVI